MKALKIFALAVIISSALMVFSSSTLAATNTAASATEITVVKFLPGLVWVVGHYKFDRFGFRVWVPAHWRKPLFGGGQSQFAGCGL